MESKGKRHLTYFQVSDLKTVIDGMLAIKMGNIRKRIWSRRGKKACGGGDACRKYRRRYKFSVPSVYPKSDKKISVETMTLRVTNITCQY